MSCEVSSRRILPAIRRGLVVSLVKRGKKQNEIAEMLHITPAAVTQYIKGKRAKILLTGAEKKEISKIAADSIKTGEIPKKDLCKLCEKMQSRISTLTK